MARVVDCRLLLLAETVLYFCSVICGLVVSIPLGVATNKLNDNCILYTSIDWKGVKFTPDFGSSSTCGFIVGLGVVNGILIAVALGAFFVHVLLRNRGDPQIGHKMWVLPFLAISVVSAGLFLVAACMVSVGFKTFCDQYTNDRHGITCSDFQSVHWEGIMDDADSTVTYDYLLATEGAAWTMVFIWILQAALGFARFILNRRQASQNVPKTRTVES